MNNPNGLGLSPDATRKVERMVDDLSFVTYPAHLVIGGLRTVLFALGTIVLLVLAFVFWMFTAKNERRELVKDFPVRQDVVAVDFSTSAGSDAPFTTTIKHLNTTDAYLVSDNLIATRKQELSQFFAYCDASQLKNPRWDDGQNWLSNKSDAMMVAYLASARNIDALRVTLAALKVGESIPANQACSPVTGSPAFLAAYRNIVIPRAPQVVFVRVNTTKYEDQNPANAWRHNYMTGLCLADECRRSDYSPRNTSIFYDVVKPQMFPHQQAAIDALNYTGTLGFWQATADANGLSLRGSEIRAAFDANAADVHKVMAQHMSQDAKNMVFLQLSFVGFLCLVALVFGYLVCKVYRQWSRNMSEEFDVYRKSLSDGPQPKSV